MLVFEKITQALAAGQIMPLRIAGDMVRIASAQWPITLELRKGGVSIGTATGMLAGDYVRDAGFDEVVIINGAIAQAITVQISGGGVGSDRVLGEVSVVDGGFLRTLSGKSFLGVVAQAAVASAYSHLQLWNPVGSAVNLFLESIGFYSVTTQNVGFASSAGALAVAGLASGNKRIGFPSGGGVLKQEAIASQIHSGYFLALSASSGVSYAYPFKEPLLLEPGNGCTLFGGTVNAQLSCNFEWYELPV